MDIKNFNNENNRLIKAFGTEYFDEERLALLWLEVKDLSLSQYRACVTTVIGENIHKYPPKISEWRELAHLQRKKAFEEETKQAAQAMRPIFENMMYSVDKTRVRYTDDGRVVSPDGLDRYLASVGCKTLWESVEKARIAHRKAALENFKG